MSFRKTKLGIAPFDKAFGGIYLGHATLLWGARASRKEFLAAQFAAKILLSGERLCVMADDNPENFLLDVESFGFDAQPAIESGQLVLLNALGGIASGATPGTSAMGPLLPFPKALEELRELAITRSIQYFFFHSVLPWVATLPSSDIHARVDTFVSALEGSSLTSLLLLPRPASPVATTLRDELAERCPIVLEMITDAEAGHHLHVSKYRGATRTSLPADIPLAIRPEKGFVSPDTAQKSSPRLSDDSPARPAKHFRSLIPAATPAAPAPGTPAPKDGG